MSILYDDNDHVIELDALQNELTGVYINTATVTVVVQDKDGNIVLASTPMSYVSGSDGKYRATLADTLDVTPGQHLTAIVSANGGAGLQGTFDEHIVVRRRTS